MIWFSHRKEMEKSVRKRSIVTEKTECENDYSRTNGINEGKIVPNIMKLNRRELQII